MFFFFLKQKTAYVMRISDWSSDVCSSDLSGVLEFSRSQIPSDLAGREGFRPRGEDERELTLTELWQQRDTPPPGVSTAEMMAAFHDRVVRSLSVLFLPFQIGRAHV